MLIIDHEKCIGCGECEQVCTFGAISLEDGRAVSDPESCTLCGACVDACPEGAIEITGEASTGAGIDADATGWQGVWIVAEVRHGILAPVGLELLGKGRELADDLGTALTAILIGFNVRRHARCLVEHGADRVIVADHPALEPFTEEAYSRILARLAQEERPELILSGATAMGRAFIN